MANQLAHPLADVAPSSIKGNIAKKRCENKGFRAPTPTAFRTRRGEHSFSAVAVGARVVQRVARNLRQHVRHLVIEAELALTVEARSATARAARLQLVQRLEHELALQKSDVRHARMVRCWRGVARDDLTATGGTRKVVGNQ